MLVKCDFTVVNDHFEDKHDAVVGFFVSTIC
jgi:hypothetical protein